MRVSVTVRRNHFRIWDVDLRVPAVGQYARIKHDFELPEFDFKPRQFQPKYPDYPVPQNRATRGEYNGRVYDYVEMPERWQWFLWDLWDAASSKVLPRGKILPETYDKTIKGEKVTFNTYTPYTLTSVYCSTIERSRSHTDSFAPEDGARDYVTNRNPNGKPYRWWIGSQGGNMVKIIANEGTHWRIEALNVLSAPPDPRLVLESPWLIHWFNEITPYPSGDGRRIVSRYPWIRKAVANYGYPETGQPFPLMSQGGSLLIRKDYVTQLRNGDKFSPYVLEK